MIVVVGSRKRRGICTCQNCRGIPTFKVYGLVRRTGGAKHDNQSLSSTCGSRAYFVPISDEIEIAQVHVVQ